MHSSKARILIVEDEYIVAMHIRSQLERQGYEVVEHTDRAEAAVQMARDLQPALILMDIHLKGEMDGIAAAAQIRAQLDIPVVFLTAYANDWTVERAREAEPFGYLIKPFDERDLVVTIEIALARHASERLVRESEAKFHSVVDKASDGIAVLDPQGRLLEWNALMEQFTELPRSEVLGRPIWEVAFQMLPSEHKTATSRTWMQAQWQSAVENAYASKDTLREYEIESQSGIRRTVQSNGFVIETGQGTLGGVVMRDVTALKLIELERNRLVADLKRKNDELERFTYTVSHDLKAPLFTIQGFLGYLEQDLHSGRADRAARDFATLTAAVAKMQRLLTELLELSRVGQVLHSTEAVSLTAIAREAADLLAGRIAERQVQLHIAPDLPVIACDRMRLTQVLQNLIDNAIKFMGDQPRPEVWIGLRPEDERQVFFVRDNGIGIAKENQARVFELFNRLESQTDGSGIGLALVKRIIETHSGEAWVESDGVGRGSTFCFTIPAIKEKHPAA